MSRGSWFSPICDQPNVSSRFAARAFTAKKRRSRCASGSLRRASQRDDRQMSRFTVEVDFQGESIAWLSRDERARPGAGRAARPAFAWLDTWSSIGGWQSEVGFVGRPALKRSVRAPRVVPSKEVIELPAKCRSALRKQDSASALVLHGPDEALDHGDATVLPDSAIAWANPFAAKPALERLAREDAVLRGPKPPLDVRQAARMPFCLSGRRLATGFLPHDNRVWLLLASSHTNRVGHKVGQSSRGSDLLSTCQ
jgi:hypothetical protein